MFDFGDWGSYGVGDFYEKTEKELRKVIESGEFFDTDWHGFKKECQSMKICRDQEGITISVSQYMDGALEETDLFCDFLTDEEMEMLTDDMIEYIRNWLCLENEYVEDIDESETVPGDATFDQIIKKAKELMQECSDRLQESFLYCIGTTLQVLYNDPEDKSGKIAEHIKQYS